MQMQFVVAALLSASIFAVPAMAFEPDDERKSRKVKGKSFEPVVDIHASPVVVQHPTQSVSGAASLAELVDLRQQGEVRDSKLRAEYQARGATFPERFPGD